MGQDLLDLADHGPSELGENPILTSSHSIFWSDPPQSQWLLALQGS